MVNQGLAATLDWLFDPASDPEGITPTAVQERAQSEAALAFIWQYFEPHRETMLLHGKYNNRRSRSWNDVDRSVVLSAPLLSEAMREEAGALGLPLTEARSTWEWSAMLEKLPIASPHVLAELRKAVDAVNPPRGR